jgi:tetratricopeptide (TPR) repeat protein
VVQVREKKSDVPQMKGEEGAGGGDSLLSLSLEFSSIDHGPPKKKPMPELPAARPELSKETLGGGAELPPLPAVDVSKMPVRGKPMELVPMVHERNGWPCHTLFDRASWALHLAQLETHNRKPGMRVIIAKAETHGPKTTPYTIYVMHIKTAFSVRGISRRFSEFKDLDEALRAVKRSAPTLPRKKTWGKMSPKFITERKRQLQAYIEAILSDPTCANSDPFRNFLGTHGHPIEQEILKRYSNGVHGLAQDGHRTALITPWRLATGTRVEAIEELVQRCRAARDVRQEARALNQLGIMESQNGRRAEAINAMRQAFMCCRQLDDADGLLSCALSWASIHAHFGELKVAEQRLHEAESMAAEAGAISGQAWCHLLQALIKASQGLIAAAAKEAVMAGELFSNADDTGHAALAQFTLGGLLLHCGEVRQAVEVLESSLLLRRRARDTLGLGESLSLLGQAFAEIGYQLHAMDYFDQERPASLLALSPAFCSRHTLDMRTLAICAWCGRT